MSPIRLIVIIHLLLLVGIHQGSGASRSQERAKHAMVVSADRLASQVGVDILRRGGNAVDAAVAVGFTLSVVYPEAGNIGGGGFMLIRKHDGTAIAIDFREKAPGHATEKMYLDSLGNVTDKSVDGQLAVGVPGTVAGFVKALDEFGTMKLADVIQPAIDLAENGYPVDYRLAGSFEDYKESLMKFPSTVKAFTRNGQLYSEGDELRQPELAATLRRIQKHGREGFYEGETAQRIVDEIQRGGGILTLDDLRNYRAEKRNGLQFSYRNYEIVSMPPPSSGGICLAELFKLVEGFDLSSMGSHSSQSVHVMTEAMKRVYADRAEYMGDPDQVEVPVEKLVSKTYADRRRKEIDLQHASQSSLVKYGDLQAAESDNTTHYCVIDKDGNAVSTTYTLNDLFGSKVVVDGAGFFLNDEMDDFSSKPGAPNVYGLIGGYANAIAPNKRMLSSMSPTILLKDHKPVMILGARGGSRIITSVFEAIVNIVDFGMNGQEAVDQPRFHHQWLPDTLMYEKNCLPADVVENLERRGHIAREKQGATGQLEAIYIDNEKGIIYGAPDPREGGVAIGY